MIGRQVRQLARAAFGRLLESDLLSGSVPASNGIVWLLAATATPGVMFTGNQMFFYARALRFPPEHHDRILFISQVFHIDFAMAVAGLVTMLVWTSLTPDRRDAFVLGPLPLRPGEQARGRLLALLGFFVLFAAAVAIPTGVAFTFLTVGPPQVAEVPARVAGHVAGAMLGAAFVFFALLDLQLLLAATAGPAAVRVFTWPLQIAALIGMVGALSSTWRLANAVLAPGAAADAWVTWNPAAWFVGVYRWIAGDPRPVFAVLAARAAAASVVTMALAVTVYSLAFERCVQKAIEEKPRSGGRLSRAVASVWLLALGVRLRTPLERGLAAFIAATLTRSHVHRFLVGCYAGIAVLCALPIVGRLALPVDLPGVRYAWFSIPLGLLCWSAAAVRVAMMLPAEPASNWVFKLNEPVDKRSVLSTAVTVIQGATAAPLAVAFGLAAAVAGGWALGAMVLAVVLTAGFALIELLTMTLRTVPCTCTYRPGQLRLRVLWPVYLAIWIFIAYRLPTFAVSAVGSWRGSVALVGSLLAAWAVLRVWRGVRAGRLRELVYDAPEPSVTTTIELSSAPV